MYGQGKGNRGGGAGSVPGGGPGRGAGRGQKGGRGAGPGGFCVCPQCGRREPHERGVPCFERTCPQCGTTMVRE